MNKSFNYGKLIVIALSDCDPKMLAEEKLSEILSEACAHANAEVLSTFIQHFPGEQQPVPITMFKALAESECSAHTYTQAGEGMGVAIVFYTCGEKANPENALAFLKSALKPKIALVSDLIEIFPDNPLFRNF